MTMSPEWDNEGTVGIFWDYENVPLRQKDSKAFLKGLKSYISQNNVPFAHVYCRTQTLPVPREKEILSIRPFDVNFTSRPGEDAVDISLIQSCLKILDNHPNFNHVLILTGDIDYRELITQLKNRKIRVTLICQEGNHSPYLADATHRAYSVAFVAEFPKTWWMQTPQAEIAAILDARYTTDSNQISALMQALNHTKPYHAAAILTVIDTRLELAVDDPVVFEHFKATVTPALKRFEDQVRDARDRPAIARVDRVWEKVRTLEIHHILRLGLDKAPGAFDKLLPLLDHPDLNYRQAAIRALGSLGDPRARIHLEDLKETILKRVDPRLEHPLLEADEQTVDYLDKAIQHMTRNT